MIAVILCAARKKPDAGHLLRRNGQRVMFVARPDQAPPGSTHAYARPDDVADTGRSWRTELKEYNRKHNADTGTNPLGLLPAWQLYDNPVYPRLAHEFGLNRLYILSAGWGLIAADFLTPAYDITFSANASLHMRRPEYHRYDDFRMLPEDTAESVVFFGSRNYVPFFCSLTDGVKGTRYAFYTSKVEPYAPGLVLRRFETTSRTNWHYRCADAFIKGEIGL